MLLGKRPRQPMRRTTSMTGITIDLPSVDSSEPSDHITEYQQMTVMIRDPLASQRGSPNYYNNSFDGNLYHHHRFLDSMVLPRINIQRRNSADFLTTCGFCKRRLAVGKDIYMYRGDTAFCSLECRERQMKDDERKEKCSVVMASNKEDGSSSVTLSSKASSSSSSSSSSSRKSENDL